MLHCHLRAMPFLASSLYRGGVEPIYLASLKKGRHRGRCLNSLGTMWVEWVVIVAWASAGTAVASPDSHARDLSLNTGGTG